MLKPGFGCLLYYTILYLLTYLLTYYTYYTYLLTSIYLLDYLTLLQISRVTDRSWVTPKTLLLMPLDPRHSQTHSKSADLPSSACWNTVAFAHMLICSYAPTSICSYAPMLICHTDAHAPMLL